MPAGAEAGVTGAGFRLQSVKSKKFYGPFSFRSGALLKLESGVFRLRVISGKSFELIDPANGDKFGTYELVPGRIIQIGIGIFAISDIKEIKSAAGSSAASGGSSQRYVAKKGSFFDDSAFGLELSLLNHTAYDWEINGAGGESEENLERTSAAFIFNKDFITARLGLITSSEWDNSIAGDGTNFENATLKKGSGWFVGLGVKVPVFTEGRWRGDIFGEVSYSMEDLSLEYGAWEVSSVVNTAVTNGATNVTTTTNYDYKNYDEDATLTETIVALGASLSYNAPVWFMYAGLKALPWSDSSLDATIVNGSSKFDITFERNDPVMAYGGGGFIIKGVKFYLEVEGGGVTAARLGLLKEL
jgi:hypothetical protein